MKVLTGHISPETAYVCPDYPYGFRLRCKIRYWLESSPNKGVRFVSQTTNPKIVGAEIWNKPKASTYSRFGGCMIQDETNGHIEWTGIGYYEDLPKLIEWKEKHGAGVPEAFLPIFNRWIELKTNYEEMKKLKENPPLTLVEINPTL